MSRPVIVALWLSIGFVATLIAMLLSSCATTVVPKNIAATQASFDGGVQDSGILTSLPGGWIISAERRANYNSLIDVYGSQFSPALKHDNGIKMVGTNIFIDDEHDVDQKMMETWKRSGTHQPKTLIQKATGL